MLFGLNHSFYGYISRLNALGWEKTQNISVQLKPRLPENVCLKFTTNGFLVFGVTVLCFLYPPTSWTASLKLACII